MEERLDAPLTHDLDPTKNGGSYLCLHSRCVQQRLAAIGNIGRHISPPKTAATSPDPQAKPSPKCCRRTMQSRVHNLRLQSLLDALRPRTPELGQISSEDSHKSGFLERHRRKSPIIYIPIVPGSTPHPRARPALHALLPTTTGAQTMARSRGASFSAPCPPRRRCPTSCIRSEGDSHGGRYCTPIGCRYRIVHERILCRVGRKG